MRVRLTCSRTLCVVALLFWIGQHERISAGGLDPTSLQVPQSGEHSLNILTPTLLELVLVNSKQPSPARVDAWDWVDDNAVFTSPDLSKITVRVNGQARGIAAAGFKR